MYDNNFIAQKIEKTFEKLNIELPSLLYSKGEEDKKILTGAIHALHEILKIHLKIDFTTLDQTKQHLDRLERYDLSHNGDFTLRINHSDLKFTYKYNHVTKRLIISVIIKEIELELYIEPVENSLIESIPNSLKLAKSKCRELIHYFKAKEILSSEYMTEFMNEQNKKQNETCQEIVTGQNHENTVSTVHTSSSKNQQLDFKKILKIANKK